MPTLRLSNFAIERVQELPRDKTLLRAIWRHLEDAADSPTAHLVQHPFGRRDRHLLEFRVFDDAGQQWLCSAHFELTPEYAIVTYLGATRAATYRGANDSLEDYLDDP
jgi:hypothetical protein